MMQCKECQEHFAQYLMGELSVDQTQAIDDHLDSCSSGCGAALRDHSESMGLLVQTAASLSDRATSTVDSAQFAWDRIHAAINQVDRKTKVSSTVASSPRSLSNLGWTALIVAIAAGFLVTSLARFAFDPTIELFGITLFPGDAALIAEQALESDSSHEFTKKEKLRTVAMHPADDRQQQCGMMVFDTIEAQIHLHLDGMASAPAGQRYVFWIRDQAGRWLSATELNVNQSRVMQLIDVPPSDLALSSVITIEPIATGNPGDEPSGRIAVVGDPFDDNSATKSI